MNIRQRLYRAKQKVNFAQLWLVVEVERLRGKDKRPRPYVAKTLRRIDGVIHKLKGVPNVEWTDDGRLIRRYRKGHGGELCSFFPRSVWFATARMMEQVPLTRLVLDW